MNGASYFAAANGLWKSDGTEAGTVLLRGTGFSGGITSLMAVNGTIYFAGTDATNGPGLWKSDGTAAGTVLIKNMSASNLANVNGRLFFSVVRGARGDERKYYETPSPPHLSIVP